MTIRSNRWKLLVLMLLLLWPLGSGAATLSPEDLMVLVVGPSAQVIDPSEAEVVARLRLLRQRSGYSKLTMATMHYDRPKEASFAQSVLGVSRKDLTALVLVQLDPRTHQPVRRLYSIPNVSAATMDSVENMVGTWAQMAGLHVPPNQTGGPPRSTGNWTPDPSRPRVVASQVYSPEGVLSVSRQAENLATQMWDGVRNEPLRSDRKDENSRRALLGVVESCRNLRVSLEEGRSNPKDRLQGVLRARDDLRRSEPQYSLPVAVRPSIPQLLESLDQVEAIYWQLNP